MILISSDLHLSDKPRDEHRFGVFDWLAKQQERYQPVATFLLGDLTEQKDKHSSKLVNRAIEGLRKLQPPVYLLRGNHDGISPDWPFFKFLSNIEGLIFISKPRLVKKWAMLPHCDNQKDFAESCLWFGTEQPKILFLHQTIEGSRAESGVRLNGYPAGPVRSTKARAVYAGDVHVPQKHETVTYVGPPYNIKFGEQFEPRVLLVNQDTFEEKNLYYPCPRKWQLEIGDAHDLQTDERLYEGDQVKIDVHLSREELVSWAEIKTGILKTCAKLGLEVFGIEVLPISNPKPHTEAERTTNSHTKSDIEVFDQFSNNENLPSQTRKAGLAILKP